MSLQVLHIFYCTEGIPPRYLESSTVPMIALQVRILNCTHVNPTRYFTSSTIMHSLHTTVNHGVRGANLELLYRYVLILPNARIQSIVKMIVTYLGLLQSLVAFMTPPPHVLEQSDHCDQGPHCPSTGIVSDTLETHLPPMHHYKNKKAVTSYAFANRHQIQFIQAKKLKIPKIG